MDEESALPSTSDYRSAQPQNPTVTFANIVKKSNRPSNEEAIILSVITDELNLTDYAKSVGNIIGPKRIRYASKISNNRICIFLDSKDTVENLVTSYITIPYKEFQIPVRRLVSPAKRVVISGVSPAIPDEVIESELKSLKMGIASPVTELKASIQDDEYTHVLSFRRVVYLIPPENETIPSSIEVLWNDDYHRIFLEAERMKCFNCKLHGHAAFKCMNLVLPTNIKINNSVNEPKKRPASISTLPTLDNVSLENNSSQIMEIENITTETNNEISLQPTAKNKEHKPIRKRMKIEETSKTVESSLTPLEKVIADEPTKYKLKYNELCDLITELKGSNNPISVMKSYTEDLEYLREMLHDLYPYLEERVMKARFTRIQTRIYKYLTSGLVSSCGSDTSRNDA